MHVYLNKRNGSLPLQLLLNLSLVPAREFRNRHHTYGMLAVLKVRHMLEPVSDCACSCHSISTASPSCHGRMIALEVGRQLAVKQSG